MTVVLGPGWPGNVLLHEAIGHGLEGDFNRKGSSAFSGRLAQRVAAKGVTIVDDGTRKAAAARSASTTRGTPTECTTLIEDGILKGYMQDKLNARLMGMAPTGNGRRESFTALPIAHDQHLHAGRFARSGRDHPFGEEGPVRAELRWRPGRYHQRQ
ncbi:hypothetical protein RLIN73S_02198 [Rhodanobacter lindaniclasticus]